MNTITRVSSTKSTSAVQSESSNKTNKTGKPQGVLYAVITFLTLVMLSLCAAVFVNSRLVDKLIAVKPAMATAVVAAEQRENLTSSAAGTGDVEGDVVPMYDDENEDVCEV